MTKKIFHFTLGPVQDFVAQSRRTRDLLVSSFLLSYLTGHAMAHVTRNGGQIVFPHVDEQGSNERSLLEAIQRTLDRQTVENGPWLGTLPNRFKAEVPADFDPKGCVRAVDAAWKRIACAIWRFVKERIKDPEQAARHWKTKTTRDIWKRQVSGYWEMSWVIGDADNLLDRRKNWRNHLPPVEYGEKCTVMSHLQELSGTGDREFWKLLDESLPPNDLTKDERLCAIALIKRLLPYVAEKAIGWSFPPEAVSIPSFGYMAALAWMKKAAKKHPQEAARYVKKVKDCGIQTFEAPRHILCLANSRDAELRKGLREFFKLDGTYIIPHQLKRFLEETPDEVIDAGRKKQIENAHKQLIKAVGEEPNPYYALLIMDGDRLGRHLQAAPQNGRLISRALALFAKQIHKIIRKFHGIAIYAGGDDVMAIFPMDEAIRAARELRTAYVDAFRKTADTLADATCSTAIVYGYSSSPLQNVLEFGRYLLDEVAKEKTGRDSLAIGVWKRTGSELVWSAPWSAPDGQLSAVDDLLELLDGETTVLSTSFLNKLQTSYERFPAFLPDEEHREMLKRLIRGDLLRITSNKPEAVEKPLQSLFRISFESWREEGQVRLAEGPFRSHGAQLIKFLRGKGEKRS